MLGGGATVTVPRLDIDFVTAALRRCLRHPVSPTVIHTEFTRVVIDSREVKRGDLFVALRGERVDGHDYAAAAVQAGAAGVLVSRAVPEIADMPIFLVDDTLAALQDLGAAWRAVLPLEIIGVTGSVGKTTTKAITAAILAARFRVQANPLNYNNQISVPLCLLELRAATERAVIEMGMHTTGEIAALCRWARPRTGIVLNVGPTHLERAGSLEAIARAKRELVEALPRDGLAVLNIDDPTVRAMADYTLAPVLWFGTTLAADVRGTEVESLGAAGFRFKLEYRGQTRLLHVRLPGAHLVSNVLAGAAAAFAEGMALGEVSRAIEALDVPTRIRILHLAEGTRIIEDTYNAQPASMLAALDLLDAMPGRHVALLGDMLELGEISRHEHERVGARAGKVLDLLVTIGSQARLIGEVVRATGHGQVHHASDREEATALLQALLLPGDAALIKGSHLLGLEHVVEVLSATDRARRSGGEPPWV